MPTLAQPLPPPPDLHNVVLSRDDVVRVPSLSEEEGRLFGLEVVSRKWDLVGSFMSNPRLVPWFWHDVSTASRSMDLHDLSGHVVASTCYPAEFDLHEASLVGVDSEHVPWCRDWVSVYKKEYFKEKVSTKGFLFFKYLDRLPSYDEVVVRPPIVLSARDEARRLTSGLSGLDKVVGSFDDDTLRIAIDSKELRPYLGLNVPDILW